MRTPPATGEPAVVSVTVLGLTEDGSSGSLNTRVMIVLSGASVCPRGGRLRTIRGATLTATTMYAAASGWPVRLTVTWRVSPRLAGIGCGSNPPSTIGTATRCAVRRLAIVAVEPSATVPGTSDTYDAPAVGAILALVAPWSAEMP